MQQATANADTKTILMFTQAEMGNLPVEDLVQEAKDSIKHVFRSSAIACVLFSGGKDSSVVANLVLTSAAEIVQEGIRPTVLILTGNTLVENPEIVEHYVLEHRKMRDFAKKHGFELQAHVASPGLVATFQLKLLSGRGIPTFPGSRTSDCTTDLKIQPMRTLRRSLMQRYEGREAVLMLGTRFSESARRESKMKARGERSDEPVRNKDGELILSPISKWGSEDVWEYVGMCSSGLLASYSDMDSMKRIYAHASATSCAVVAEAIEEGVRSKKKGGCTTRTGCFICQQAEDKSLAQMVEFDDRYAYARGLLKLNKFIRDTRYDWSRRHWVGRTINKGWIAIEPDSYHPDMIRALSRAMLQLDFDEKVRAERAGERPKFQMISLQMLVAIDALQSLNGVARPFQMWADLRDIESGIRFELPETTPVPQTPMPETRFLYVGEEWDTETSVQGLRSAYVESLLETSACLPQLRATSQGRLIWDVMSQRGFDVDLESALMIEEFEKDRLLAMHDAAAWLPGGIKSGYEWYQLYGVLKLDHAQRQHHDEVARRTAWKDLHGLTLNYSITDLCARSVRYASLPVDARAAWASKATSAGCQTDFLDLLEGSESEQLGKIHHQP